MVFVFQLPLVAQTITDSPYSKFGLGELNTASFAQQHAMGGSGIALRSPFVINVLNPASYSSLRLTTFDVGANIRNVRFEADTQSFTANKSYFNHLALAVPVTKWWGLAFGIMPYSGMGYNYVLKDSLPLLGRADYYYKGEGGLNKAFIGNGFSVKIDSLNVVSFGANVSYLFGDLFQERKVVYNDLANVFNTWVIESNAAAGFNADFGLQYTRLLSEKKLLTLGITYAHKQLLRSSLNKAAISFSGNPGFEKRKDTLYFKTGIVNHMQTPESMGAGLLFENSDKLSITAEAATQFWSKTIYGENPLISDSYRASAGMQWVPSYLSQKYFQTIRYRAGVRYASTYWNIKETQITEYGISFGLGLPIKVPRSQGTITYPFINVGAEIGQRGTTENNLMKEQFINFYIGISISDKWFVKRKYD